MYVCAEPTRGWVVTEIMTRLKYTTWVKHVSLSWTHSPQSVQTVSSSAPQSLGTRPGGGGAQGDSLRSGTSRLLWFRERKTRGPPFPRKKICLGIWSWKPGSKTRKKERNLARSPAPRAEKPREGGAQEDRSGEGAIRFAPTLGKPSATSQVSDFPVSVDKKNPTPTRAGLTQLFKWRDGGKVLEGWKERRKETVMPSRGLFSRIKGRSSPLASSCQTTRSDRQRTLRNSVPRLPPTGQAGLTQRNASAGPAPLPQPRCSPARCCSAPPWRSVVQVSEYLGARHLGLRGSVHPGRVSALTSPGNSRYSEYPRKTEAVWLCKEAGPLESK